jgi:hypothetical protein
LFLSPSFLPVFRTALSSACIQAFLPTLVGVVVVMNSCLFVVVDLLLLKKENDALQYSKGMVI